MEFEEEELSELEIRSRNLYKSLSQLRNSKLPLMYGDFIFHEVTEHTLAYSRAYFENQMIIVFNKSDKKEQVEINLRDEFNYSRLKAEFGHPFETEDERLIVTLPANSFEILTL